MNTSAITRSQCVSEQNMTSSGFRAFTDVPATASSGSAALSILVIGDGSGPLDVAASRRRSAISAKREAEDPAFRERKRAARAALMAEMGLGRAPSTLAQARMARGLSQHELAALTGLTQPHIAKIEARKLAIQLATARKIAAALSISIDELAPLVLPPEATDQAPKAIMEPR
ncbi:helix-turn-helix domain-containing protein [Trinickia sp.]|uniref:helix-turn-helix domain-containing protein n=1 Tax=Trinickia sp. TaxID=2571163 RepID=UPI003F7F2416